MTMGDMHHTPFYQYSILRMPHVAYHPKPSSDDNGAVILRFSSTGLVSQLKTFLLSSLIVCCVASGFST